MCHPGSATVIGMTTSCAPIRQKKGAVFGIMKAVFAERDSYLVRELYRTTIDKIGGFCSKAVELLEEPSPKRLLTWFPYERHARLRINNVQERSTASSSAGRAAGIIVVKPWEGRHM